MTPTLRLILVTLILSVSFSAEAQTSFLVHDSEKLEVRATHTAFLFEEEVTLNLVIKDKSIGNVVAVTAVMGNVLSYNDREVKITLGNNDVSVIAIAFGDKPARKVNHLETIFIPVVNDTKTTAFLNADGQPLIDKQKIHPITHTLHVEAAMSRTERCQDKIIIRKIAVSVKTGSRFKTETFYSSTVSMADFTPMIAEGSLLTVEIMEADCVGPLGSLRKIYFAAPKNVIKATFSFEAQRPIRLKIDDVMKNAGF